MSPLTNTLHTCSSKIIDYPPPSLESNDQNSNKLFISLVKCSSLQPIDFHVYNNYEIESVHETLNI